MKQFYHDEWKNAKKEGNYQYAEWCKEKYREIIMNSLKRPYKKYVPKLKAFPPLWLN